MERPQAPPDIQHGIPLEGGIETSLLAAILTPGRLSVVFQPIFDVTNSEPRMYGVEALIRGPRGTNAEKPTVLFEYVRRRHEEAATDRACFATIFAEAALLPKQLLFSVNVHASTLGRDDGFAGFVADTAQANGLSSRNIVVEIVEHAPPFDVPGFRKALKELREALGLSLDLVAAQTRIRQEYLSALEEERFADLPLAAVNIRGFLTAFVKHLGLATEPFVPAYMQRYRDWQGRRP